MKQHVAASPELVMAMPEGGAVRLSAVTLAAQKAGLSPGQTLADARALMPDVPVHDADPAGDGATLERIAAWCTRYTPWTAPSGLESGGAAGIWLDVSGCAHLFGGEAPMLDDMTTRLANIGYTARAGLADTAGAAWAAARFGKPGKARRFGELPARRLDQALGRVDEPISPRVPAPVWRLRTAFAEALGREEHIAAAARNLTEALCNRLARAERGARRLELCLYRVGGRVDTIMAGTAGRATIPITWHGFSTNSSSACPSRPPPRPTP